jgi:hypothetical protein
LHGGRRPTVGERFPSPNTGEVIIFTIFFKQGFVFPFQAGVILRMAPKLSGAPSINRGLKSSALVHEHLFQRPLISFLSGSQALVLHPGGDDAKVRLLAPFPISLAANGVAQMCTGIEKCCSTHGGKHAQPEFLILLVRWASPSVIPCAMTSASILLLLKKLGESTILVVTYVMYTSLSGCMGMDHR